jgi:hypothetical protein
MANCFMPIHLASGHGGSGSKTSEVQDVEVLDQLYLGPTHDWGLWSGDVGCGRI